MGSAEAVAVKSEVETLMSTDQQQQQQSANTNTINNEWNHYDEWKKKQQVKTEVDEAGNEESQLQSTSTSEPTKNETKEVKDDTGTEEAQPQSISPPTTLSPQLYGVNDGDGGDA